MIFNIQRYSTHDGGGIRTNVFLKGCPLSCVWCSNPESQRYEQEIFFDVSKCIGCGSCVELAEDGEFDWNDGDISYHKELCLNPLKYKDICPTKAIEVVGEEIDSCEVLDIIMKDVDFYKKSGGGVTFTGGEALSHTKFLTEILPKLNDLRIHTAVETCLDLPWNRIGPLLKGIDLFLVDLKHLNQVKLKRYTKGDVLRICQNIERLDDLNKEMIIRIPVIPGFNDTDKEMGKLVDYVCNLKHCRELHLLPYHTYGIKKYDLLGKRYEMNEHRSVDEVVNYWLAVALEKGLKCQIGG